jgi:hypothetical protein
MLEKFQKLKNLNSALIGISLAILVILLIFEVDNAITNRFSIVILLLGAAQLLLKRRV